VRISCAFIFISLLTASLCAQEPPPRTEQLIYSVVAFNGKDYSSTFCAEDSGVIYLQSDVDNFLMVRKTFVYFWPITESYRLDTSVLDKNFDGTLAVSGGNRQRSLEKQLFTYYNLRGTYELNWKVAKGEEARAVRSLYEASMAAYQKAVDEYRERQQEYQQKLNDLSITITRLRREGKDAGELVEELQSIPKPVEPRPPDDFAAAPVEPRSAFVVNLPEGDYSIRFINPDGTVMENSDKQLKVFGSRREGRIGYELIPGDKWTRPVESKKPSSVLYLDGSTDIYIRPFIQSEYNDLYYEKLLDNQAEGNPNLFKWVRLQQVPAGQISIRGDNRPSMTVEEEPFSVRQREGSTLGYRIIPYNDPSVDTTQAPSLIAVHIPLSKETGKTRFFLLSEDGEKVPGSERQIRVITAESAGTVPLILVFFPLLVMMTALLLRSRKYAH
jgi:hypothetical protein